MELKKMKRAAGFSMIELMVSVAILVSVVGVALKVIVDAQHANEGVTLLGETNANLRASMTFMGRDIIQAGEGIPQSGIPYPQGGAAVAINWPAPPTKTYKYPLPAPLPQGSYLTPVAPEAGLGLVVSGAPTDMVTVMFVDNSLVDAAGNTLNAYPVVNPAPAKQICNGVFAIDASNVTFDKNCVNIAGNSGIKAGDLIMFSSNVTAGTAIQTVTSVSGQEVFFAKSDAFNFNGQIAKATGGTMAQLENPSGSGLWPSTTAARVKMVTYYIDSAANPLQPQLMRMINFNTPEPVGQGIEDLQISYGIANSNNPALYGAVGPGNTKYPLGTDTPANIREVNLFVAARSENAYSQNGQFFRNNMVTKICVRSLSFVNIYN